MKQTTIQARIDQKGLKKINLFFDQKPKTILHEILQNCRRAKATFVEVTVCKHGQEACEVTITDNGKGIGQPKKLLHLLASGWDKKTKGQENPAGVGLFSLSHLEGGVRIHSQNWKCHIEKHVFAGEGQAEILPAPNITGTRASFHLPIPAANALAIIETLCQYYPVPTRINKKQTLQEDFLKDCEGILETDSLRIGIQKRVEPVNLNFHGLTLKEPIPCPEPFWFIKVDIKSSDALDLVLPARNAVVANAKLKSLVALAKEAVYKHAAQTKSHALPYKDFLEAGKMGISLPEARAELCPIKRTRRWDITWETEEPNRRWRRVYHPVPKNGIISTMGADEHMALELAGTPMPPLFRADPDMDGYSWYPKQRAIQTTQIIHYPKGIARINPEEEDDVPTKENPKRIELELVIEKEGKKHKLLLPTTIAFTSGWGTDCLYSNWVSTAEVDPETLSDIFFNPCFDGDADSLDRQKMEFRQEAETEIIRRKHGNQQSDIFRVERALNAWEAQSSAKALGTFTCQTDRNGTIRITKIQGKTIKAAK
jgi:hypothetical protein